MLRFIVKSTFLLLLCLTGLTTTLRPQAKQYSFDHFSSRNGLNTDLVHDIIQDEKGYIWLASLNGLQRFDGNKFTAFYHQPSVATSLPCNHIKSLFTDNEQNLWVITALNRVGIFDKRTYKFKEAPVKWKSTEIPRAVKELFQTKEGNLILLASDGIYIFRSKTSEFVPYDDFIPQPKGWKQNTLTYDKYRNLFLMACDSGIAVFDPITGQLNYRGNNADNNPIIEHFGHETGIYEICSDSVNSFFISGMRQRKPLFHYLDLNKAEKFSFDLSNAFPGLLSSSVTGMTLQSNGRLWIYGKSFIIEYNAKEKEFKPVSNECTDDNGIRFNITYKIYEDREQNLWVATDNGIFLFNPDKDTITRKPPSGIWITDFKIGHRSLQVDSLLKLSRVILPYDNNSITIEFNTLSFLDPNNTTYYYQLEGIDKEWVKADERNQAIYSYLPSGNYTFRVRCKNSEGISSQNHATLLIKVEPPLWKSWWFYAVLALVGVTLFYLMDRQRIRRLVSLQEVRSQIAGNLHDQLNTTLNNINLLSEMAKIKADKDTERSKEYIDQISEKSRHMIEAMDDMLWSISPENDRMQKTLLRMYEYAEGLKNTHGLNVEIIVDKNVELLTLDMRLRSEVFLLFKEVLNNIINSNATNASIRLHCIKSKLLLNIQDDSTWYEKTIVYSSLGMEKLKKKALSLNAKVDIQTDKVGTSISISIPLK